MPLRSRRQPREGRWWLEVPGPGLRCRWRRAPGARRARASAQGTLHCRNPAVGQGSPDGPSPDSTKTRHAAGEKKPICFSARGSGLGTWQVESGQFAKGRKEVGLFKPFGLLWKNAD